MKESQRKYTGTLQYFHNYEHDPEGRKHCKGAVSNPYRVKHSEGKHIVNLPYAKGHGKHRKTQWFKFNKRSSGGWDMTSGVKVPKPPIDYNPRKYL